MKFSERIGITKVRDVFQGENIDETLKNEIWNNFQLQIIRELRSGDSFGLFLGTDLFNYFSSVWIGLYKIPIDTLPSELKSALYIFRTRFFSSEWFEIYDLIEYTAKILKDDHKKKFIEVMNISLKNNLSSFVFLNEILVKVTDETELSEIEDAQKISREIKSVQTHINSAINLLSNRASPDYRNSIKESISAVEAFCQIITGDDNATLPKALKALPDDFHPALKQAFEKIYAWTSDDAGIRHAMSGQKDVAFEDAKFMLVACSAFINYLKSKTNNYD